MLGIECLLGLALGTHNIIPFSQSPRGGGTPFTDEEIKAQRDAPRCTVKKWGRRIWIPVCLWTFRLPSGSPRPPLIPCWNVAFFSLYAEEQGNPDHTALSPRSTLADEVLTHGQNAADGVVLCFLFSAHMLGCRNVKCKAVCSVPGQPNQSCFYILPPHQIFLWQCHVVTIPLEM